MTDYYEELVYTWYERAHIDYSDLYARLYISYNAWFRKATRTPVDREAIVKLKKRFIIWDDYLQSNTLKELRPVMLKLSAAGVLEDETDWRGLISFWYEVRCDLFHGAMRPCDEHIQLAYESLSIFMQEIVTRMRKSVRFGSIFNDNVWSVDMQRVVTREPLYSS